MFCSFKVATKRKNMIYQTEFLSKAQKNSKVKIQTDAVNTYPSSLLDMGMESLKKM